MESRKILIGVFLILLLFALANFSLKVGFNIPFVSLPVSKDIHVFRLGSEEDWRDKEFFSYTLPEMQIVDAGFDYNSGNDVKIEYKRGVDGNIELIVRQTYERAGMPAPALTTEFNNRYRYKLDRKESGKCGEKSQKCVVKIFHYKVFAKESTGFKLERNDFRFLPESAELQQDPV